MTATGQSWTISLILHLLLLGALALMSGRDAPPLRIDLVDLRLQPTAIRAPSTEPAPTCAPLARPEPHRAEVLPTPAPVPPPCPVPAAAPTLTAAPTPVAAPETAPPLPAPVPTAGPAGATVATAAGSRRETVTAGSSDDLRRHYLSEHFAYIRERVLRVLDYPAIARKKAWAGQVRLAFIICEDGRVENVRVLSSSGFGILDREAVATVARAAPFPPPPVRAEVILPVRFALN